MKTSPRISVIVPVYNAEKWLHRCIDSILAQTFTDFELLLIDDGSTDGSGAICDEYGIQDQRVRVFHKPNGGVSSARNLGLDNAKGGWISFVDSDDWIETEYLGCLLHNANGADLSICDFIIKGSNEVWPDKIEDGVITTDKLAYFYTEIFPYCYLTAPWIKLYKKSIIEDSKIRFNENISTLEDTIFVLDYLRKVKIISCINRKLYNYWRLGEGLSRDEDLLMHQMPQISAHVYSSLNKLSELQKIDVLLLYLKILNSRFYKWVFPRQCTLKELYYHFKKLGAHSEIRCLYNVKSDLLGMKYKLILRLISNGQIAIASLGYKMYKIMKNYDMV